MEPNASLKVLAVDDNRTNLHIVQVFLAKLGHRVVTAQDGAEAVERFVEERPDLILLDIMMPVMNGFEAARRIRALCQEHWVPIIFLSALDRDENLVEGLEAGGDDYLTKPLNFVVLEAKMRSMQRSLELQARLSETCAREQATADAVLDAVVSIDTQGRILSCNQGTERIFQWQRDELLGQPVETLMPSPHRELHQNYMRNYLLGGAPQMIGLEREVTAVRRDGEVFPVELGITEIHGAPEKSFVGVIRDITARKRYEQALQEQAGQLREAVEYSETEKQLAAALATRQLQRPSLHDSAISYWSLAAARFSGDVIAAARNPRGVLHVLLGDATGHGLAAAICALPVTAIFYRLVAHGFDVSRIVREINQELYESVPTERFVGVAIAAFDFAARQGEIWNGGIPEVLWLRPDGSLLRSFASTHLPLGIEPSERIDSSTTPFPLEAGGQFVFVSDGLIEAENAEGAAFGSPGLLAAAAGDGGLRRLARIKAAVMSHLGATASRDDVSLLLVDCP